MLTRFNPFAELDRFQRDVSHSFDGGTWTPAVDIFEDTESIQVRAELPGMKNEDVKIDVENNILTLRGERKLEHEDKREHYHRVERFYGTFTRQFILPRTVDAEKIEAALKEGVLTVRLPKKAEVKPRAIAVKS